MRAQVLAIALVMSSAVALLCMSLTSIEALTQTADAYYDRYRFAHVFARVERAPERLVEDIRELPGVEAVSTRVVKGALLEVPGFEEPVVGQLVAIPERERFGLNQVVLRAGRWPTPGAVDEAIFSEPFARAHALKLGSQLHALMNGRWQRLTVVGVGLSPEYVYSIGPGALMPDDRRFGIAWLAQDALAAAYDLEGAFNDVSVTLRRDANPEGIVDRLDDMLRRYGGLGAYSRKDQVSNWFLMNEIEQLEALAGILPVVFLSVAAFLINMVLARLVAVERSEIGLLKAFGYDGRTIAWHYVKLVLAISAVGIVLGWVAGYFLGLVNTRNYANFFTFPFLLYSPGPASFLVAGLAASLSALIGALRSVGAALKLPPAEAMRPPAPPAFRKTALLGLLRSLDQPTRIVVRQLLRWPVRSFSTALGLGMAIAVLVSSLMWIDSVYRLVDVHFAQAQRQDVTVGLVDARSGSATSELSHLSGVVASEPTRVVQAKFRFGARERRESLQGLPAHQELGRVLDANGDAVDLPADGLVVATMLADILGAKLGDEITIEVLEGRRVQLRLPIVRTFETYMGSPAYIEIHALNRWLHESGSVSAVHLRLDETRQRDFFGALKRLPGVGFVTVKDAAVRTFHETMARTLMIYVSFFVVFACALTFGVAYNTVRIALSERGREFATMRVLGFTRLEVSYILLGDLAILTFCALPLGCALGYGLARTFVHAFETELYRVPLAIDASTYAIAMVTCIAATVVSALLVRRRVDRLDLVAVLKTRE
jgi:putative ABC transport system permease protein